jgi:hypothetical protein
MKMKKMVLSIVAIIAIVAGCVSMGYIDSVEGPRQVRQGEDIDPRDITVWVVYPNGERKVVSVNASDITFDKNTPGPQIVRVRVNGQEASFRTEVIGGATVTAQAAPQQARPQQPAVEDVILTGDDFEIQQNRDNTITILSLAFAKFNRRTFNAVIPETLYG